MEASVLRRVLNLKPPASGSRSYHFGPTYQPPPTLQVGRASPADKQRVCIETSYYSRNTTIETRASKNIGNLPIAHHQRYLEQWQL